MSFSGEVPVKPADALWHNRIAAIRRQMRLGDAAPIQHPGRSLDEQIIELCNLFVARHGSREFNHLPLFAIKKAAAL